jgi:hypothetical protein
MRRSSNARLIRKRRLAWHRQNKTLTNPRKHEKLYSDE